MSTDGGQAPRLASALAFDAVLTLTPDLLEAYGLTSAGHDAEAAARLAVERLPGAVAVRVEWRGPVPDQPAPPLVTVYPLGSSAELGLHHGRALADLATASVRAALQALSRR